MQARSEIEHTHCTDRRNMLQPAGNVAYPREEHPSLEHELQETFWERADKQNPQSLLLSKVLKPGKAEGTSFWCFLFVLYLFLPKNAAKQNLSKWQNILSLSPCHCFLSNDSPASCPVTPILSQAPAAQNQEERQNVFPWRISHIVTVRAETGVQSPLVWTISKTWGKRGALLLLQDYSGTFPDVMWGIQELYVQTIYIELWEKAEVFS